MLVSEKLDPGVIENDVRPRLAGLTDDSDKDVKYFAQQTLDLLGPAPAAQAATEVPETADAPENTE